MQAHVPPITELQNGLRRHQETLHQINQKQSPRPGQRPNHRRANKKNPAHHRFRENKAGEAPENQAAAAAAGAIKAEEEEDECCKIFPQDLSWRSDVIRFERDRFDGRRPYDG